MNESNIQYTVYIYIVHGNNVSYSCSMLINAMRLAVKGVWRESETGGDRKMEGLRGGGREEDKEGGRGI